MGKPNRSWVIALSFVVAFMLTAAPLPDWALAWRPAWIAMVLVYWCIGVARTGRRFDRLDDRAGARCHARSILGQHAFGLAFVAYITIQYHQRLRVFPLTQQAIFVASLIFLYLVMMLWIYNVLGSVKYGSNIFIGDIDHGFVMAVGVHHP